MTDSSKRISVVLASYQGAAYIEEQLDSLLAQTRQPDEVLLRDDGSSDDTLAIVQAWQQRHPAFGLRIIEGGKNLGYIGNFRTLMEQAGGDWIFLCDQDDRWHAEKLETMMAVIEANPQIRLLASSFSFMNGQGECYAVVQRPEWSNNNLIPWKIEHPGGLNTISAGRMLDHNYFQGCAMAVSREVVRVYLQTTYPHLAHDWYLALIAARQNGLFYLDRPLFDYRIHQANVTGLPQAEGSSKLRTLKTWFNGYYRKVVVEDQRRVLEALNTDFGREILPVHQTRLDFCSQYLEAINGKHLFRFLRLYGHPGRLACVSKKEFVVSSVYVALSRFFRLPDHKGVRL